jgi:predicted ATP-grasp superfamily ATP-dependent carboligase
MPQESRTSLPGRVLVAGVSTRAAAESAARAGFAVTAIDAFGDLDQHASVRGLSLARDFGVRVSARSAAHAARTIDCDAVAYLSSFDNHPGAVATLAAGRALWGNAPAVLRRVRDPMLVARALRQRGSAAPDVYAASGSGPAVVDSPPPREDDRRWLVKPLASGGGHRVRPWRRAMSVPRGCYLQELVDGTPGSVAFVAAGGRAVPLGVSRQLIGEDAFGASGYRYCGNILAAAGDEQFTHDEALVHAACALARSVAAEFDLVGVNGIDFVECRGVPYAVEVNPRWSASMELVEQAYDLSVFGAHAAACGTGVLPEFDFMSARSGAGAVGKAVVFARRDVAVGDTRAWLEDRNVRDVPHPGERIRAGRPVCTVFAADRDGAACHAALVGRAERVYEQLAVWEIAADH